MTKNCIQISCWYHVKNKTLLIHNFMNEGENYFDGIKWQFFSFPSLWCKKDEESEKNFNFSCYYTPHNNIIVASTMCLLNSIRSSTLKKKFSHIVILEYYFYARRWYSTIDNDNVFPIYIFIVSVIAINVVFESENIFIRQCHKTIW